MKKIFRRGLFTLGFLIVLLTGFLLNPVLLYSHATTYKNCTIYHNKPLSPNIYVLIDKSITNSSVSEIYNEDMRVEICLNDGSYYPGMVERIMGVDVIRSISNKSVVHGEVCTHDDCMFWKGREVKFSQWLTHSFIHNLQFYKHGFWNSNPIGRHPDWKWEGYAEYISLGENEDLMSVIEKSIDCTGGEYEWTEISAGMGTTARHFRYLAMTKFCFEIKKWNYSTFLDDSTTYEDIYREMTNWYYSHL